MTFGVPPAHSGTLAQWLYDGTLVEFSGSGAPNLEVANGTLRYCEVAPGVLGVAFDGGTGLRLRTTAYDANLDLATTAALTIEMLVRPFRAMTLGHLWTLITHGAAGAESKFTNAYWGLRMRYSVNPHEISWHQEYDAYGTDIEFTAPAFALAPGCLTYLVARRSTNPGFPGPGGPQRVEIFANKRLVHDETKTIGGGTTTDTSRRVYVGSDENDSSTTQFRGAMALIRLTDRVISDGEMEAATDAALGSFGTRVTR